MPQMGSLPFAIVFAMIFSLLNPWVHPWKGCSDNTECTLIVRVNSIPPNGGGYLELLVEVLVNIDLLFWAIWQNVTGLLHPIAFVNSPIRHVWAGAYTVYFSLISGSASITEWQ